MDENVEIYAPKSLRREETSVLRIKGTADKVGQRIMAPISRAVKRYALPGISWIVRSMFQKVNPVILGNPIERTVRYLGFFDAPEHAEVVANYLRGYLLFGRSSPRGAWFHWYWLAVRSVMTPETAKVPIRMRRMLRRPKWDVKYDQDVEAIMHYCRKGREGWLTPEVIDLYLEMHKQGLIATAGTYRNGILIGGFWGLSIGPVLGIMSMFHLESNGGAAAITQFTEMVSQRGCRWSIIDFGHPGTIWDKFGTRAVAARDFSDLVTNELLKSASMEKATWVPNLELAPLTFSGSHRSLNNERAALDKQPVGLLRG